jgi:signal transduction histidine kinase
MGSFRPNLRFRLTAALVSIVVLSVLATGGTIIHYGYGALKRQKQQDESTIARNISAQVAEVLDGVRYKMDYLARDPGILSMEPRRLEESVTLVTETSKLVDSIIFVDMSGRTLARARDPDTPRIEPPSARAQFVEPVLLRSTTTAILSPIYGSRTGERVAAVLVPVKRGGRFIGVLAGGILLRIHSIGGIDDIRVGESGYAYIVDSRGAPVALPQSHREVGAFAASPAGRALIRARGGIAEYVDELGIPNLAAYAPVANSDWGVLVVQPAAESYEFAERMRFLMSLALLASAALSAIIGTLLAERIAQPVSALAAGVRTVTEGRFDVRIPVARSDEVGKLAEAFNEMAAELAQQKRRTEESHREMLRTQRSMAQSEKMITIGQFAAGLAHEIYNPLTVIAGFGEFLLDKTPPSDARRGPLEDILRETTRCRKLVSQLLDFAKPKGSERIKTDLNQLLRETLALVQNQVHSQKISVEERLAPDLPTLELDRDEIKQVFLNLFLNACQAMPDGGTLRVRTRAADGVVAAVVEDDGVGIGPQQLPKIFDAFYTTKAQGTGLGLALSYAMIERHGGRIQVRSRLGEGTIFTITLNARPAPGGSDEQES